MTCALEAARVTRLSSHTAKIATKAKIHGRIDVGSKSAHRLVVDAYATSSVIRRRCRVLARRAVLKCPDLHFATSGGVRRKAGSSHWHFNGTIDRVVGVNRIEV